MRPELKQKLDKELSKTKRKNLMFWLIPVFSLVIIVLVINAYSKSDGSSVTINGVVVSQHAQLYDDGHKIYLMVKVPDTKNLVKVALPKYLPIKRDVAVELRKKSTAFNYKYTFVRYIE
jgi:hypothetical protein